MKSIDSCEGFCIGDRVISVSGIDGFDAWGSVPNGMTGVVKHLQGATPGIGVRWDKKDGRMHTLNGHCEDGYGWYVVADSIQHEELGWDCDLAELSTLFDGVT